MVTGDHEAVAKEIAREVNLGTNIIPASAFHEKFDDETQWLIDADGFTQVFPEHKYQIVQTLQNEGHIVGMTGDGVNDAPALKKRIQKLQWQELLMLQKNQQISF